jgi:hypothetical protein
MKTRTKILFIAAAGLIATGWSQAVLAQSPLATTANTAVQITEARKANALFMRQYSWTSRTELIEEGQVKDTRIEQVSYGPDGQLQRILLNDTSAPLPRGFLRRDIAEQKRQEMEQYTIPAPTTAPVPAPMTAQPSPPGTGSLQSIEQKLKDLKSLFDQGLISQSDYEAKKAQLLQGL